MAACRLLRDPAPPDLLDVRLQAGLLLVVLYEERQVLGPVVLKVPRQVLVHVVLGHRDVEVRVQVAGVLWWEHRPRPL